MTDLFGALWLSKAGDIAADDGTYTQNFLLWCRKLKHLRPEEFAHGFEQIEKRCADNSARGLPSYPPSYAEFLGMCSTHYETQCHKPYEPEFKGIEDLTGKERRKQRGKAAMAKLRQECGI